MTQTKKKSPKSTKKQPINVQLSKDDLKELLTVLKTFIMEEVVGIHRVETHRMDCHNARIISLEGKERRREQQESNLVSQSCPHEDRFESIWYSLVKSRFHYPLGVRYKCKWCGRVRSQDWEELSSKQRKALKKLGVQI